MLSSTPGILYVTEHTDTEEVSLTLLRDNWQPNSASLPPRLEPCGLSNDRKWYLYYISVQFALMNRRMLHVHAQPYQTLDITSHQDLKMKETHSCLVIPLTELEATLFHRMTAIVTRINVLQGNVIYYDMN